MIKRLYSFANELGISPGELLKRCKRLGFAVKHKLEKLEDKIQLAILKDIKPLRVNEVSKVRPIKKSFNKVMDSEVKEKDSVLQKREQWSHFTKKDKMARKQKMEEINKWDDSLRKSQDALDHVVRSLGPKDNPYKKSPDRGGR